MKTNRKEMILSILPAIIFYLVYKMFSYKYALIAGFCMGVAVYGYKFKKFKKITTFDKIGIFGLVAQTLIGMIAENPKIYFLYPLIQNIVFATIFIVSLGMNTDAISYIAKDFNGPEEIPSQLKAVYRKLTLIWGLYFIVKAVIKVVGIMKLSFDQLYIINWFVGTPVGFLLLFSSFWYPKYYYRKLKESFGGDGYERY